jgi:hypothetical protein
LLPDTTLLRLEACVIDDTLRQITVCFRRARVQLAFQWPTVILIQ